MPLLGTVYLNDVNDSMIQRFYFLNLFGSKTADQRFDEMQKKTFFLLKFAAKFLLF